MPKKAYANGHAHAPLLQTLFAMAMSIIVRKAGFQRLWSIMDNVMFAMTSPPIVKKSRQASPDLGPTSAFYSRIPAGMRGPTCVFFCEPNNGHRPWLPCTRGGWLDGSSSSRPTTPCVPSVLLWCRFISYITMRIPMLNMHAEHK